MLRDSFFWLLVSLSSLFIGAWWLIAHREPLRLRSRGGLGTVRRRRRSHR
jgi:hypothetical protein